MSGQLRVNNITNEDGTGAPSFPNGVSGVANSFTATVGGSSGTSDWTGTDPVTATVTVTGLLSTDVPLVDIDLSSVTFANVADVQTDWGLVYRVEASATNTLKLYATAEPASSFSLTIQVVR